VECDYELQKLGLPRDFFIRQRLHDNNRLAAQCRILLLFAGRKIGVDVHNKATGRHFRRLICSCSVLYARAAGNGKEAIKTWHKRIFPFSLSTCLDAIEFVDKIIAFSFCGFVMEMIGLAAKQALTGGSIDNPISGQVLCP
jgi:hypothetical protein